MLFSNPQSIGEIYKIHGSASVPNSLVLTSEDYEEFTAKNPYLAAKLVTIFVEHPIIFIGYSIADPHIRSIISSIAACLPQDKIALFEQNLIFVRRVKGEEEPDIERNTIQFDDFSVSMTVVKVSDYGQIYSALTTSKRKIPARVLRFFKEQLYDLVHTPNENVEKLAVVDFDEINSAENVEFVVGVGVAQLHQELGKKVDQRVQDALSRKGYAGVTPAEIFIDCVTEKSRFNAADLLSAAYPALGRSNRTFIPVFRYLNAVEINSEEELKASPYEGVKKVVSKLKGKDYSLGKGYISRFKTSYSGLSTKDILEKAPSINEACIMLGYQDSRDVDLELLRSFLLEHSNSFNDEPYVTAYRKLVCRYDKLKFGF